MHHHICLVEWGASPAVWHVTAPCSYKQGTSREASCAPANDKWSPKVMEMNEFDEPLSQLLCPSLAAAGSTVCISIRSGTAPGGGQALSHCSCHSLLSLQFSLDPITWQVSVEAGTIRCQFATRWAEAPSGLLIVI